MVLVYRPGLPNALDRVTFRVEPGEKLGIVGRTGSGKSSLFLVLFRLLEPSAGRVLLDGVDTSQLELAELRSGGQVTWEEGSGTTLGGVSRLRAASQQTKKMQWIGEDRSAATLAGCIPISIFPVLPRTHLLLQALAIAF